MKKELLQRYASLKSDIKRMTAELETIKPEIVEMMEESGTDEVVLPDTGKFFFKERRVWTYDEYINDREKELKAEKKIAQQKGKASCEIIRDLNFRGKDEQGNEDL